MAEKCSLQRDFSLPGKCIRACSRTRYVCLVPESWLRQVHLRSIPQAEASAWDSLTDTECCILLAPSYATIPRPWTRVMVKVIQKEEKVVESFVEEPLSCNIGPGVSELLSYVSRTNFRRLWEQAQRSYSHAKLAPSAQRPSLKQKAFNDVVRSVLLRLFRSAIVDLDSASGVKDVSSVSETSREEGPAAGMSSGLAGVFQHPNVLPAYTLYESEAAFYVVQPYAGYSLHDVVTFSPAALGYSYTQPLFILYQVLRAMRHCHRLGLSAGQLQARNLLIDNKLWVSLTQPHRELLARDTLGPKRVSSLSDDENRLRSTLAGETQHKRWVDGVSGDGQTTSAETCTLAELPALMQRWVHGEVSNYDYLMALNRLTGRRRGDPNHHPTLPWVMDFTRAAGGYRDLARSKFRLNKGDCQLDLTYDTTPPPSLYDDPAAAVVGVADDSGGGRSSAGGGGGGGGGALVQVPHHVSDVLSDITYYVYTARRTPKAVLCQHVRSKWVPHEYPSSVQRMQEWTPDECIPEFFTDPSIFTSIHDDLPDLELPPWASSPEDFVKKHMAVLEGEYVSQRLHHWIDLTFGYKLSGNAAVKAKNVCLQLVDQHTELLNHGVVQLFNQPHPSRLPRATWSLLCQPRLRHGNVTSPLNGEGPEKKEAIDKKLKETTSEPRPEDNPIFLPKGFDPLAMLDQVEAMYNFSTRTAHSLLPDRDEKPFGYGHDLRERLVSRDLQSFGCLIVELFHSAKLRVLSPETPLVVRYSLVRKLCAKMKDELPRPVRQAVNLLLNLQADWSPEDVDPVTGCLFKHGLVSRSGLPAPTADLLLHPQANIIPFPKYFPGLYGVIARLKTLDMSVGGTTEDRSGGSTSGGMGRSSAAEEEKVAILMKYLTHNGPKLGKEGLDLLLPYIIELLENPSTSVNAAWSLFEPVAQVLGPQDTAQKLLEHLTRLFDGEQLTRKHMKLYHRSYVIQLLVRLGATSFLQTFTTLLVEASAGFKNFCSGDKQPAIDVDLGVFGNGALKDEEFPSVFVDEGMLDEGGLPPVSLEKTPEESDKCASVSIGEEVLADEDEWAQGVELDEAPSDSGSADPVSLEDRTDSQSFGSAAEQVEPFAETSSTGSVEASEELLGRSVGRLSVHSVSRLLQEEAERSAAAGASGLQGDNLSVDGADFSRRQSDGSGSMEEDGAEREREEREGEEEEEGRATEGEGDEDEAGTDSKGEDLVTAALVQSETEEFTSSLIDNHCSVDYNISHVAAETIKWLSHRLGPVLTAKWLSRNLLRMLELCYYGEDQLEPSCKDFSYMLSTTNKPIVGDYNASQVLECISCIAVLYGEHVILLQYFPHCRELISQGQKKLTGRTEAGLLSSAALLNHMMPYLSDATLMDILQETIFKDLLLPLLKLVSSAAVSFPSGARARTALCHKLIDALYIISLRIGFEMTRRHMTYVLQKFFAAFSRVHEERPQDATSLEAVDKSVTSPSQDQSGPAADVYVEIKRDAATGGYKIGTPVKPPTGPATAAPSTTVTATTGTPWQPSHQRQGSGNFRYSLSPASQEERDETDTKGVDSQDHIMNELRQTFTPHLAHLAYIPFCKLAGGIHMEQNLFNDDLIRQLCTMYDEALSQQNAIAAASKASSPNQLSGNISDSSRARSPGSDDDKVSGSFGRNVSVAGNKIVIAEEEQTTSLDPQSIGTTGSNKGRRKSGETAIDYNKLRSPEMDFNKQRHLKGNWLAYWEHELGLSERETSFNFKQIKLQTFIGHTNSVRSLYILDNENSFISASKDKTVKLWSLRSFGDGTGRVGCQWTYGNHKKSVFAVTFLDSVRLAASCDSVVHIWDPFMGMGVRQFESSRNPPVTVLTPMPAPHSTLITATTDATLRFLDVRAASYMHEFKCSTGPAGTMPAYRIGFIDNSLIRCTAVSPDGHWVAVGYSSGIISILDLRTGLLLATWKGHEGEILQVRAYNNKTILTTSLDQSMTLWSVEDAKALCHFKGPTEPVHCTVFYRGEILSATTGNRVGLHTSVDRKASFSSTKLRSDVFRGVLTTMAVMPQNRLLLLGADNGTIRLLA